MYADLVALRPGDAALRLEYAQVLARHRDKRDEALEQYRKVLARRPSFDTREEYADLLSARADLRGEALEQYAILVRARPDDVPLRLKYARLLSAVREDTRSAIAQYDAVLVRDSRNPAAHEGLARSYAWLDDRDLALEHANLADRYGSRDVGELRKDLLRGREPRLEPLFLGLVQRGRSKSELNGLGFGLRGQLDPSPFATLRLEAGFEDYWRSGDNTAGGYFLAGGEFRFDPTQRIDFELGYHSLGSGSSSNVVVKAEYAREGERLAWRAGFARRLRYDSYPALVGERVDGVRIGEARENRFHGHLSAEWGRLEAALEPYTGWVDADGVDANPFVGLRGRADYQLRATNRWKLAGVLGMDIYHYRDDAFGVDPFASSPLPGGYFSPQFFFEVIPGISTSVQWGESAFLDLEGGPALQVVNESGGGTEFNVGGHARLSYLHFIRASRRASFGSARPTRGPTGESA